MRPALVRPALVRAALVRPALVRAALVRAALVRPALVRAALVRPALVRGSRRGICLTWAFSYPGWPETTPSGRALRLGSPTVRTLLAAALGAVLAALAAVILGEYSFSGAVPVLAGVAVPLAVGEAASLVAGGLSARGWLGVAAASVAALASGAWLSQGPGQAAIPAGGWLAIALGAVVPTLLALGVARRRAPGPAAAPHRDPPSRESGAVS
ncbi:MAG: hypothetical protein ACRDY0_00885 [Acidimicrobiales bacterium]